ncbi:alkaline phosphatase D family protein [Phycisphaeraceae bacterium D3-23]
MSRCPLPPLLSLFLCCAGALHAHAQPALGQGIMAGEVTADSVLLQTRLTDGSALVDGEHFDDGDALRDGDLPGCDGYVRWVISTDPTFLVNDLIHTGPWLRALPEHDYVVRHQITGLAPGTTYYYRADYATDVEQVVLTQEDHVGTFTTLHGEDAAAPTRIHIVTGLNYDRFYAPEGYTGDDRAEGFPACDAMLALDPDLLIFTGDDVYYDKPPDAETLADMRAKWHRQFSRPRMAALLASVATYWEKDDHDFRYNDSDLTRDRFPSAELGIATFREQAPIVAQDDHETPTYRTHRVSRDLQIWLVEGRDYRSANRDEDGPGKTLWGAEQRDWLMRTLLESDATFKLLISPTPLLGPDDAYKRDNHANLDGFRHEGEAFITWAQDEGLWDAGLAIVCGDRHWQYHSVHPSGAHEFSCGAICDANSRLGRHPGDENSTDPAGELTQPYRQAQASGGFLSLVVTPADDADGEGAAASIRYEFYDERGELLYRYTNQE